MGVHRSGKRDKTQKDGNDAFGAGLRTADMCDRQCAHGPLPWLLFLYSETSSSSALPRRLDFRISRVAEPSHNRGIRGSALYLVIETRAISSGFCKEPGGFFGCAIQYCRVVSLTKPIHSWRTKGMGRYWVGIYGHIRPYTATSSTMRRSRDVRGETILPNR